MEGHDTPHGLMRDEEMAKQWVLVEFRDASDLDPSSFLPLSAHRHGTPMSIIASSL